MTYEAENYIGSECWKNIEYCNDADKLLNIGWYIDTAIMYHSENRDEANIDFFKQAKEHWKSRCDKLNVLFDPIPEEHTKSQLKLFV